MAQQWMGFTISIDCGPMGVFQGVVTAVEAEPQSVTLSRVFHNGVPHTSPSIVIRARDIKDLTIIAAPQAQLDPVVELKKPIPTRPGRNFGDGAFHSQPAPPRTLHLQGAELEPWNAGAPTTSIPPSPPVSSLPAFPQCARSDVSFSLSGTTDHSQPSPSPSLNFLQLSALRAGLPDELKSNVTSQAASVQNVPQGSLHELLKLNAAASASQRASMKGNQVSGSRDLLHEKFIPSSTAGGFKMTSALASPRSAHKLNGGQSFSTGGYQNLTTQATSKKGLPTQPGIHGVSQSNSAQTYTTPTKTSQSISSRPFQLGVGKGLTPGSAAEAFFRGSIAQGFPQGITVPTRHQNSSHGAGAQSLLQVNTDGYASGSGEGNRTPNRKDRQRQRWQARDEACFGSPSNNGFDEDFDFESNLALFDKQAVYDEIAIQRPDLVLPSHEHRRPQNYRHDQNVIVNNRRIPTIIVPNPGSSEYVTDDGLIIPTMRPELLLQLHQKAHDLGFSYERQSELLARCATEMSLQLLGGAHRLNPHNAHQWPTVIVMVGPHHQGTAGVMCARQLECQGVSTVTLVVNEAATPIVMKRELNLYKCGGGPIVSRIDQLPDTVDLVIMALAGHSPADVANSLEYGKAACWASNKRASVLALDPPPVGTPGIITKFALSPTLPMTYSPQNGKIYLCNIGVPVVVFKEMGIRYRSPFGSKFVIPLHPNDE